MIKLNIKLKDSKQLVAGLASFITAWLSKLRYLEDDRPK